MESTDTNSTDDDADATSKAMLASPAAVGPSNATTGARAPFAGLFASGPASTGRRGSTGGDRDADPVRRPRRDRQQVAGQVVAGGVGDDDVGVGAGWDRRARRRLEMDQFVLAGATGHNRWVP